MSCGVFRTREVDDGGNLCAEGCQTRQDPGPQWQWKNGAGLLGTLEESPGRHEVPGEPQS